MADKKRTTARLTQAVTPHRLKKRCTTKFTATPHNANLPPRSVSRAQSKAEKPEEIETARDDWFSLPLPTSPAPSPPRPKEICPQSNCTLSGNPNDTVIYTYRKIYNEDNQTQRDELGRETAGRHRIPAREFSIDRSYMTPSSKAMEDHGIAFWPDPPMRSMDDSSVRDKQIGIYHESTEKNTVVPTPPSKEPIRRVHTTGRKPVARRRLRLFLDDSGEERGLDGGDRRGEGDDGVMDGEDMGMEGDSEEEDVKRMEEGKTSSSTSRKRRGSKIEGVKARRRLYSGSVKSDGVRVLTSSEEELKEDENDREIDDVVDEEEKVAEEVNEISGNFALANYDENAEDGELNKTLEVEIAEDNEKGDENAEEEDEVGVDGNVEEEEEEDNGSEEGEEEMVEMEDEEIESEKGGGGDGIDMIDEEEESMEELESSDSEGTLREERSERQQDDDISDRMNNSELSRSFIGDVSLIDNTLPLNDVVNSIVDEELRRLLAVCNQKNVINMEEFMSGVLSAVKVGEGGYAEVFLVERKWEEEKKVFKILKVEENEDAGKFLGEVIISKELTRLRTGRNSTNAFAKLYRARVIRGLFPQLLSDAWEQFRSTDDDALNEDNPEILGDQQMFLCLECEYGGLNLKKFPFSSALELLSVYCQTALALAVAESEFKFEHRDLHEENVLVKRTEESVIEFTYDRKRENGDNGGKHEWFRVPTHGVKTTIIDFTLSRMTRKSDVDINHELGDEICDQEAEAEQYQVYKKMKKLTNGHWNLYTPKSNVLWLRMQINWIIQENLNPKSDLNKKRKDESKTVKGQRTSRRRQSKRKSAEQEGETERTEMSGEMWIKKIKEAKSKIIITKLKEFAKLLPKFDSADDVVSSDKFRDLVSLLDSEK